MIPPWLTLRLAATVLIVVAIFGAGLKVGSGFTQARWDAERVKVEREHVKELKRSQAALEAARQKANEASNGYQNELTALRNRPVSREPVRLCKPRVQAHPNPSGPGPTSTPAGVVSGTDGTDFEPGDDIGPDLRELARRADEVSAQGRGLQSLSR